MKRFLLSLLAMLALVWTLDRIVGMGMEHLFRTSANPTDGDVMRHAADYRAPVVICGASRASHHYMSDTLASELGVRVFNLGRDGSWGPTYEYGCSAILTRHYTPGLWIMDVESSIVRGPELLDRLSCFLPNVQDEPVARELVSLRSRYEALRLCSRTYVYNSLVLRLIAPRFGHPAPARQGYLPLYGSFTPSSAALDSAGYPMDPAALPLPKQAQIDTLKTRYLKQAVELLQARGVVVLAVRSPRFILSSAEAERDRSDSGELTRVFGRLNVRFLDFSATHLSEFQDARLYRDSSHLNETGALKFTRALADSLRSLGLVPGRQQTVAMRAAAAQQ